MRRDTSAGLPTRAALQPDGLYLALKDIAAAELQDPFLHHTVSRARAPERIVRVAREELGAADPATAPAGVIFHVGRCGSTVLSQALKQLDGLAVYSEPLPVNELLSPPAGSRQDVTLALRSLGAAFAAHAGGPYVIKLSSWVTLFADVIADAFPQSPWLFCVREPVEVGEAVLRDSPLWFSGDSEPARHIASIVDASVKAASAEDYFARVYAAFCDTIARLPRDRGQLLRYEELSQALTTRVPEHFGLRPNAAQASRMRERTRVHAKAPLGRDVPFAPDAATKQAAASPELRRAVDAIARPAYERILSAFP